jgi:hypothetical protein
MIESGIALAVANPSESRATPASRMFFFLCIVLLPWSYWPASSPSLARKNCNAHANENKAF